MVKRKPFSPIDANQTRKPRRLQRGVSKSSNACVKMLNNNISSNHSSSSSVISLFADDSAFDFLSNPKAGSALKPISLNPRDPWNSRTKTPKISNCGNPTRNDNSRPLDLIANKDADTVVCSKLTTKDSKNHILPSQATDKLNKTCVNDRHKRRVQKQSKRRTTSESNISLASNCSSLATIPEEENEEVQETVCDEKHTATGNSVNLQLATIESEQLELENTATASKRSVTTCNEKNVPSSSQRDPDGKEDSDDMDETEIEDFLDLTMSPPIQEKRNSDVKKQKHGVYEASKQNPQKSDAFCVLSKIDASSTIPSLISSPLPEKSEGNMNSCTLRSSAQVEHFDRVAILHNECLLPMQKDSSPKVEMILQLEDTFRSSTKDILQLECEETNVPSPCHLTREAGNAITQTLQMDTTCANDARTSSDIGLRSNRFEASSQAVLCKSEMFHSVIKCNYDAIELSDLKNKSMVANEPYQPRNQAVWSAGIKKLEYEEASIDSDSMAEYLDSSLVGLIVETPMRSHEDTDSINGSVLTQDAALCIDTKQLHRKSKTTKHSLSNLPVQVFRRDQNNSNCEGLKVRSSHENSYYQAIESREVYGYEAAVTNNFNEKMKDIDCESQNSACALQKIEIFDEQRQNNCLFSKNYKNQSDAINSLCNKCGEFSMREDYLSQLRPRNNITKCTDPPGRAMPNAPIGDSNSSGKMNTSTFSVKVDNISSSNCHEDTVKHWTSSNSLDISDRGCVDVQTCEERSSRLNKRRLAIHESGAKVAHAETPQNSDHGLRQSTIKSAKKGSTYPFLWTAEMAGKKYKAFGVNAAPVFHLADGRCYRHPPLPPGWTVSVSRSKNIPFYIHPDFGSTFYCPISLPSSDGIIMGTTLLLQSETPLMSSLKSIGSMSLMSDTRVTPAVFGISPPKHTVSKDNIPFVPTTKNETPTGAFAVATNVKYSEQLEKSIFLSESVPENEAIGDINTPEESRSSTPESVFATRTMMNSTPLGDLAVVMQTMYSELKDQRDHGLRKEEHSIQENDGEESTITSVESRLGEVVETVYHAFRNKSSTSIPQFVEVVTKAGSRSKRRLSISTCMKKSSSPATEDTGDLTASPNSASSNVSCTRTFDSNLSTRHVGYERVSLLIDQHQGDSARVNANEISDNQTSIHIFAADSSSIRADDDECLLQDDLPSKTPSSAKVVENQIEETQPISQFENISEQDDELLYYPGHFNIEKYESTCNQSPSRHSVGLQKAPRESPGSSGQKNKFSRDVTQVKSMPAPDDDYNFLGDPDTSTEESPSDSALPIKEIFGSEVDGEEISHIECSPGAPAKNASPRKISTCFKPNAIPPTNPRFREVSVLCDNFQPVPTNEVESHCSSSMASRSYTSGFSTLSRVSQYVLHPKLPVCSLQNIKILPKSKTEDIRKRKNCSRCKILSRKKVHHKKNNGVPVTA